MTVRQPRKGVPYVRPVELVRVVSTITDVCEECGRKYEKRANSPRVTCSVRYRVTMKRWKTAMEDSRE